MWPCVAVPAKPFAQRESIELMTANQLHRLEQVQVIDRPLDEVFEIFSNAANLEALTPTFLSFRILTPLPIAMFAGAANDLVARCTKAGAGCSANHRRGQRH